MKSAEGGGGRGMPKLPRRDVASPIARPQRPTESLGPPLVLTLEQIDQTAEVTPVDVASARGLWGQHAPAPLAGLLDAQPTDGGN